MQSLVVQFLCIASDFAQSARPTARPSQGGRPGPKSRSRSLASPNPWRIGIFLLYQHLCRTVAMPAPVDTRVGGNSHLKPPGALHTARPHEASVANHNGVFPSHNRHPKPARMTVHEPRSSKPLSPSQPDTRRLHFLSWNAGSLTTERHRELTTWLGTPEGKQVGLVAVQETHWRGPLEYMTTRFAALHSGASRPEGGICL